MAHVGPGAFRRETRPLVEELMAARRAVGVAKRANSKSVGDDALEAVDAAKPALGERGRGWRTGGTPDFTRHTERNMPYADRFAAFAE